MPTQKKEETKQTDMEQLKAESFIFSWTPWFWNEPLTSQTAIRWIKWRWVFEQYPLWLKDWDIRYNTESKQLQVYSVEQYRWFGVKEWIFTQEYQQWDYVKVWNDVYIADTNISAFWPPPPSLWRTRTAIIRQPVSSTTNYYHWEREPIPIPYQSIPSTTDTNFVLTPRRYSDDWMIDTWSWNWKVLSSWLHQIITKVERQWFESRVNARQWYTLNWNIAETDYIQGINITATTIWTDSIGWPITATTTINYTGIKKTITTIHYALLNKGDVVWWYCRHDYTSPLDVMPRLYLVQIQ